MTAQDSCPPTSGISLLSRLQASRWLIGIVVLILLVSIGGVNRLSPGPSPAANLRALYSGPQTQWPAPWIDADVEYLELAAAELPPRPDPQSPDALKVALGERLFNDPILSASGHVSCQSCHNRHLGWGDGLPRSFGHGRAEGRRNAPSLFTAWARSAFFWDGRADTLKEQATGPLAAENEMANHDLSAVPHRLKWLPEYSDQFKAAYGDKAITLDKVTDALAAFQKQLDAPTRFDRFLSGETALLTDQQIEGLHLFRTKARCANCHMGPTLMDGKFHKIGLAYYGRTYEDMGRYAISDDPADAGAFLTPSLRHVSRTGPYMHNGLFPTLRGLVNLYNAGGAQQPAQPDRAARDPLFTPATEVSAHLKPLDLTAEERAALIAFLEAL